ncbi:MAG: hypothetical protein WD749_13420 [Phycisphaerales bacterium]
MRSTIAATLMAVMLGGLVFCGIGCRHTAKGVGEDTESNAEWVKERF